ncbi:putative IS1236 transposase [Leptospira interrogans str. L0996]|nr:putative IS1236 transposase [Leptospira interrogans str. L0996]
MLSFYLECPVNRFWDNYFYKIQEAEELLFDHIEVYYNRHRSHSSLDFVSPVQFEVNAA